MASDSTPGDALVLALRADDAGRVATLLQGPDLDLARSLPPYGTWDWARTCSMETLRVVVDERPDVLRHRDARGRALVHELAADPSTLDKLRRLLSVDGLDPDPRDADLMTPLYLAAAHGNERAVTALLQHDVDVNAANSDNRWTVLMAAVAGGYQDIVVQLLGCAGIDVDALDDQAGTALHLAVRGDVVDVADVLLDDRRVNVNLEDHMKRAPLTLAVIAGRADMVERLLERFDLDPNLVDRDRQTALHWAAAAGEIDIVRLLASDPRVNPHITNRPDCRTPRDLAVANGHVQIATELEVVEGGRRLPDDLSPGDSWAPRPTPAWEPPPAPLIPEPPSLTSEPPWTPPPTTPPTAPPPLLEQGD